MLCCCHLVVMINTTLWGPRMKASITSLAKSPIQPPGCVCVGGGGIVAWCTLKERHRSQNCDNGNVCSVGPMVRFTHTYTRPQNMIKNVGFSWLGPKQTFTTAQLSHASRELFAVDCWGVYVLATSSPRVVAYGYAAAKVSRSYQSMNQSWQHLKSYKDGPWLVTVHSWRLFILLPDWESIQAAVTMTWYPTQSHFDTELTSPWKPQCWTSG